MARRLLHTTTLGLVALGTAAAPGLARAEDLFVNSNLRGASIFLNGMDTGLKAPATVVGLTPGAYQVVVQDDCNRGESAITVLADQTTRANVLAVPTPGTVVLNVEPSAAVISVDDDSAVVVSGAPARLTCGPHTIRAALDGYIPAAIPVDVRAGQEQRVQVRLQQLGMGSLELTVTPRAATILFDGKPVGSDAVTLPSVFEGKHVIGAEMDGHQPATRTVAVEAGADLLFHIDLRRNGVSKKSEVTGGPVGGAVTTTATVSGSKASQDAKKRAEAEAQAKADAERVAKAAGDRKAAADAQARKAQADAEAEAARQAELQGAVAAAEAKARADAEARLEAERQARLDAEARAEAERQARLDAEARAETDRQAAASAVARAEAERKAKAEAEAKIAAERKATADAEARIAAERKAKADAEAKVAAERKATAEAEARAQTDADKRAKAEAARDAAQAAAAKSVAAAEKARREAAEAQAKADAEEEQARREAAEAAAAREKALVKQKKKKNSSGSVGLDVAGGSLMALGAGAGIGIAFAYTPAMNSYEEWDSLVEQARVQDDPRLAREAEDYKNTEFMPKAALYYGLWAATPVFLGVGLTMVLIGDHAPVFVPMDGGGMVSWSGRF